MEDKKEKFLAALRHGYGIIATACEAVGIGRSTYYRWYNADQEFKAQVDEVTETQVDFVESRLIQAIKAGDTTATIFYLKTKGKKRGYSEKVLPKVPGSLPNANPSLSSPELAENGVRRIVNDAEVKRIVTDEEVRRIVTDEEVKRIVNDAEVKRIVNDEEVRRLVNDAEVKRIVNDAEVKRIVAGVKDGTVTDEEVKRLVIDEEVKRIAARAGIGISSESAEVEGKSIAAKVERSAKDEARKRIAAKVKRKKAYIVKLLKEQGKYTAELTYQVDITAKLLVRADMVGDEIMADGHQTVNVEYSREGNERKTIDPREKLYVDLLEKGQKALRALGMNTESKERRSDNDELNDFLTAVKPEEDE